MPNVVHYLLTEVPVLRPICSVFRLRRGTQLPRGIGRAICHLVVCSRVVCPPTGVANRRGWSQSGGNSAPSRGPASKTPRSDLGTPTSQRQDSRNDFAISPQTGSYLAAKTYPSLCTEIIYFALIKYRRFPRWVTIRVRFWRERAVLAQQQAARLAKQPRLLAPTHPPRILSLRCCTRRSTVHARLGCNMVQARALPYAGIDASWEEQQFAAFQQLQRAQGMPATSYADFVFGRLLEEDLHVSCKPMLPPCADQLHGVTLQGMCILQVRNWLCWEELRVWCLCACAIVGSSRLLTH